MNKLRAGQKYMKIFCINDALDEQVFREMNANAKYKITVVDKNWDVAGRYRIACWIEEFETVTKDEESDEE